MNFNLDLNEHDGPEIEEAVLRAVRARNYINGPEVQALEEEFAAYTGRSHAIAVGSGTDALYVALASGGIGILDEVITSAFGVGYTALAIEALGAIPVFADVEPESLALDPYSVEDVVTERTKAILPVHYFGDRRAYPTTQLVEDAAQVSPGQFERPAAIVAHSCYPTKNLGAFGDAGILTTDDGILADEARMRRDAGRDGRYTHARSGLNMMMDEVQAAVLRVKLKTLPQRDRRRLMAAEHYWKGLEGLPELRTFWTPKKGYAPHLFVVQTKHRDKLQDFLTEAEIPTLMHYPLAVPDQPVFRHQGEWPVARKAAAEVLSLPFHPDITKEDQDRVIDAINRFFAYEAY